MCHKDIQRLLGTFEPVGYKEFEPSKALGWWFKCIHLNRKLPILIVIVYFFFIVRENLEANLWREVKPCFIADESFLHSYLIKAFFGGKELPLQLSGDGVLCQVSLYTKECTAKTRKTTRPAATNAR